MENGDQIISRKSHSSDHSRPLFSVIAIHDGYQAEMQVNRTFAWLHQSFRDDLRMSFNAWTFEKLVATLVTRAMSVRIGTEANMIIIATSSAKPLPEHIKRWLDSISWQPREDRALVLSLAHDSSLPCAHTCDPCEYLQHWGTRRHADIICCADIHHLPSRQCILRRINDRFHNSLSASPGEADVEPAARVPLTTQQTMNQNQSTMNSAQIQEVRGLAYHLWLQADRPAGKEIDFWLRAEQQIFQAAAEKAAHESSLNATPAVSSDSKKSKSNTKQTK